MQGTKMNKARFYTTGKLSEHMAETPEGFLICYDVPIARTGQYVYKNNEVPVEGGRDGLIKVLREKEMVFSPETIQSFEGKPVTINHPDDFVTPQNWQSLSHGTIQNVRQGEGEQEDLLISDIVLTTEDAIKLVKGGLREVSCGYDAGYEQIKPGYAKQKDIIGNHVALVMKGRAGSRCAIRDGVYTCDEELNYKEEDKEAMKKKSGVKDVLRAIFPKLNLDSVSEEDLVVGEGSEEIGELEKAQQAAAEAKQAATQAVEAAKEAAAAVDQLKETSDPVATEQDAEGGEETDPIAMLNDKIDALTSLVQGLIDALGEDSSEDEESVMEEGEAEVNEEIPEEKESTDADEDDDDKEKEGMTADALWQDTISRAEIIAPGIVATKPKATNMKKVVEAVKRQALSTGMTKDHAAVIKPLIGNKKIASLTADALDMAFISASEMIAKVNSAKVQKKSIQMKDLSSHVELADINKRNRDFWNKK